MKSAEPVLKGLFITGTSTGVGKTWITSALTRLLRQRGVDAVALKPFCCGSRDDAELLQKAADSVLSLEEINPVWFRAPAAPYVAAMVEGRHIDINHALESVQAARSKHRFVLVEGAGGWRVPILRDFAISDLAQQIGLPIAVVASNRLGVLNHTLLTLESIKTSGNPLFGTLLNDTSSEIPESHEDHLATLTNASILEELLGCKLLDHIPWNGTPDRLVAQLVQHFELSARQPTNESLPPTV
jgi:dethiobiotin synthetase